MFKLSLMVPSKETDNKLRWETDVEGVAFKLYIPKWRVPRPWSRLILVRLSAATSSQQQVPLCGDDPDSPISAIVERICEHSETARFAPRGDPKDWQIGEPYIPYKILPSDSVRTLRIDIEWDHSAGTWTDH